MEKISELGLELIELEDQVLLVDKEAVFIENDWAIHKHDWYRNKYKEVPIRANSSNKLSIQEHWCKIIASTKPLEGLPLLVIEDDIHQLSTQYVNETTYEKESDDQYIGRYSGFISGYNKARQTYKFTEEDLRKAMKAAVVFDFDSESIDLGVGLLLEGFIQSLTKKELWIQTTISLYKGNGTYGMEVPKITNNQIKAVWK